MDEQERTKAARNTPETVEYEQPRIRDYGTLADLTAFKPERGTDWSYGSEDGGSGGGYS